MAFQLIKGQEFKIPDSDDIIFVKFLKDTADFEVFYNDQQIDDSATSSKSAAKSLKWVFNFIIGWYAFILLIFNSMNGVYEYISYAPENIFYDPFLIYMFTSSIVVLGLFIAARMLLISGNMTTYKLALGTLALDTLYAIFFLVSIQIMAGANDIGPTIFAILLPGTIRGIALYSIINSYKKYEEYCINVKGAIKGNEDTLDL